MKEKSQPPKLDTRNTYNTIPSYAKPNSLPADLISNVTIARKGFPRMGYSACFGGPMFNTLLGLGLSFGVAAARSPELRINVRTGDLAPGCIAFLLLSLLASALYLGVTGFAARRSYGYLLYSVYAAFMLLNVLSELHVVHPLGTDHRPDGAMLDGGDDGARDDVGVPNVGVPDVEG